MDACWRSTVTSTLPAATSQTNVYPGVAEGLAALGGRKGTATTKGSPTTRAVLDQFGLIRHFSITYRAPMAFPASRLPTSCSPPGRAGRRAPKTVLFVGDSAADMEAGRRAGVKTCAVTYGYGKRAELAQFTPDYWIDDLRELAAV